MMKNLFRVGLGQMAALIAIICCLTLTTNQTFAQCDAGGAPTTNAAVVCPGVGGLDIGLSAVDIPTGVAAGLYGAYVVTITDGGNIATVLFEGNPAQSLTPALLNAVTISIAADGTVTAGTPAGTNAPVITGSPLAPGVGYTAVGDVYLGTDPTPDGLPIRQDFCAVPTTAASAAFDIVGNFLNPNGINPLTNYDCISPDVAQIPALDVTGGTAPYTVNAATEVYSDAGLTTAYMAGDPIAFPNPLLFVPANTVWSLTVQDANGCESTVSGQFETPQAEILALSNDYCQFDAAVTIYGDPNGAPYVGPVTDPLNPLVNDLPVGTFFGDFAGYVVDNGNNTAAFDPFLAGPGQHSVFFVVGTDIDCQAIDQQIVNVYPSFIASFDGGNAPNANPLPLVVCQGANGGAITIEPDVLDEDVIPALTALEDVFFIDAPNNGIAAELQVAVVFDGPGIVNNGDGTATFDTSLPPGTYTITSFVGYEQCVASQSHSVTIVTNVDATTTDVELCATGSGQVNLTEAFLANTTPGGTFAFNTVAGQFDFIGGNVLHYDPLAIPAGGTIQVDIDYTVGDAGIGAPCFATSTFTVFVDNNNTQVSFDLVDHVCLTDGVVDLDAVVTGADKAAGTFAGTGVAGTTFDPAVAGVGTFTITYTQNNGLGACTNVLSQIIEVKFAGDAAIADVAVCEDAGVQFLEELAADFNGLVTAGSFSGLGVTDFGGIATFDPTGLVGTVAVQYCIGDDECEDCQTFHITVFPSRDAAVLTAPAAVCSDAGPLNLSGYLNAGAAPGTLTASAGTVTATAAGTMLDISGIADGTTVTITYTPNPAAGVTFMDLAAGVDGPAVDCYVGTTTDILINGAVDASFTVDAEPFVCAGDDITVTPTGTILGTSTITFNGGTVGAVIPTTGLDGLYEITHTVTNGVCSDSDNTYVYIIGTAVATSNSQTVCADAGDLINLTQFLGAGTTPGGGFTNTGGAATVNAVGGVLGPGDVLLVGSATTYDVTYTVGIEGQCAATTNFTVTVVPTPDATLASPAPDELNFCFADGLTILPNTLVAANTYTVVLNGTTLVIPNGGQGQFQTTETVPTTETFTIQDGGVTVATVMLTTGDVLTYDGADVTVGGGAPINLGAGPYSVVNSSNVTVATFTNTGDSFTFTGTVTNIIPNPFVVNGAPLQIGLNTLIITVTTPDGCTDTFEQDLFFYADPVAAFNPTAVTVCTGDGDVDLSQYLSATSTSGGSFSSSAATALTGSTFDPAVAGVGVHTVTYNVGLPPGCAASATLTITVVGSVTATFDLPSSLCAGQTIDLLDYVAGNQTGTFTVNGAALVGSEYTASDVAGPVTIVYTYPSPDNGCGGSATEIITVIVPSTPTLEDNIVCQSEDDYTIDLTQYLQAGPAINGGTFQFAGIGAQAANGGAFINEIEYSETATNSIATGDFIEVAGAAGTDLRDYLIVLYEPNQYVVNDTPQFGETNGRVYAVISPELGYGWIMDIDPSTPGYDDPDTPTNDKWYTSPDVLGRPGCPQIGGDPDVFLVSSVEEGVAGDWIINPTYSAANGASYGALAIDLGYDPCNVQVWEGLKMGPAAIALVYKGDFSNGEGVYDTGDATNVNENGDDAIDGFGEANMTVTQFIGYGGDPAKAHLTDSNFGIFTATDGPAVGLSTTDVNAVDDGTTYPNKSLQFTNAGWVVPFTTGFDPNLNYPDDDQPCLQPANDVNTAEDQSPGFLNWGQLAPGDASYSNFTLGCALNSSAEENYFDYISPNGDILDLSHFDATLFVGGLVATESAVYTAGSDGDSDAGVLFNFTKNQVLPIGFTYQVPSGTPEALCADSDVNLFVMMDYEEYWQAPAFICEGDGVQNMNDWILQTVSFVPFTVQASGSHTFTANIECDENIPSLFISELNYFGKNVTSTDEHCVTYNYIQDAFAAGGFGGVTFIDYNPATDNVTVKFCDGVEISGLTGTDLSCYQLIFYRPDPTLVASGQQSTSLAYDVVYIGRNGIPVSTDVENLVYMNLYGTIDDDYTPNGNSEDIYYGFNGTTVFRLDGSNQSVVPGFGALDLRLPATRAKLEFITAPTEFYTIPNPQDNALANSIPNYNGPCGTPFSPININADCAAGFIDPDGVPVSPLAGGIYIDINGNGLVDIGTDLLVFKDRDGQSDYDPGEQTTGTDGCVTTDDVFPWERESECRNDATGRLTSGDAFTNRGRSKVGSRWFPILDIDESVSGVGLYNKCSDVGPIADDLTGETLEFLSWGEQLCVQNQADFTEAGPFEQQFSEVIDSLDAGFGDLRSLQLVSCNELPAALVSGCGTCTDETGTLIPGATAWVTIFNGGAVKIPVCPEETAVTANQFSNSFGYYNCQLDEDISEAAPCTIELTISDEDLPDNYIITDFLVQATATGGFVYQWELGDRTGCYYDESDRGCQSSGCGVSPGRVNCMPGEASLGVVTDLVTGASVNGFTLIDAVGNRNGPLGCDFAFDGAATKVAERTYYLDIAAAVGQTLNFPVIPSGADSCYNITQNGTFTATLSVAVNYEQCHYVGAFGSSDATVDGNIDLDLSAVQGAVGGEVPVDPFWTLDPAGLQDFSPILVTYDIPNANVGDADEATDDVSCIDNNTDEDQRDQLINIIYSDPAELVDGALTVCSTSGPVNLVNLLAPGTPASGAFTTDASGALTGNFSFDPAAAGAGSWTVTYTTNFNSACQISDNVTINVVEVTVQAPTTVCSTDGVIALSANVDGTFAGAGVIAVEGGFAFDPAAAGAGTTVLTFTTADCSGQTSASVTVLPSPSASFFVPSQACMADGDITFAVLGAAGGTFTVNGEAIMGNVWTPTAAGYVAVEYTVTAANGCTSTELHHVNVFDVFNATWTHDGGFTVCENDLPLTLTVAQTGGTWTSDINSTVTVEEQEITEEVADSNFVFTIDGASGDTLNIDTIVTFSTVVIGTVEVVTFDADIENADHGSFSVTYEGGGANCGQAETHVINVYNVPDIPVVTPTNAAICDGEDAPVLELVGNPSYCNCPVTFNVYDGAGNLVYEGETQNNDVFDTGSVVDGPGDYTFSVVTVNKVCESDAVEVTVTVNESPSYDYLVGCTDPTTGNASIEITNVTTAGPYSVSINDSEFFAFVPDQSLNVLIGGEINTVVVKDGKGCTSAPLEISVDEAVRFDAVSDCPDADGNSTVTVVPNGGTGPYQVSVNGGDYGDVDDLTVAVAGDAVIRVKDSKGCESRSKVVSTSDPVTFTATASCPDENGQSTIVIAPVNANDTYVVTVGDIDLAEGVLTFQAGGDVTVVVTSTTTGCASAPFVVEVPAAASLTVTKGCPKVDNITGQSFTTVTFGVDGLSTVFINGSAIMGTSASLSAGTYTVVAVNADGCESAPQTVEIVDNVSLSLISASSQTIVCGEGNIILAPTGGGAGATYNYYLDAAGTIPATPASGDVWVNGEVVGPRIIYVIATTADGCKSATLAASTYHYQELSVSDLQTTCNVSDGSYTVTFTISGGNGVYSVNGASAPESFTSASIPAGQAYTFTIDDSPLIPSCEPLTVAGAAPDCTTEIDAVNDVGVTTPGEPVTINILTNDTGCGLSVVGILVNPSCGTIMDINLETGAVVYVANAGTTCTEDTFTYQIVDCNGNTTEAVVTIFITQEGDLIVQVERDCTNAEETGVYTLNISVNGGTAPYTISGAINEVLDAAGFTFVVITDGNPYEISVVDAAGNEFFEAGGEIACTKLAVDFIEFYGEVQTEGNFLTWITATEENNDFFVVEHSTNGKDFAPIGTVDGAGTSNEAAIYDFLHRSAPSGMSYYRIKAVAFDGEATYTKVINLVRGERAFGIVSVYPVPVSSVVNINFTTKAQGTSTIQIHNVAGKLMSTQDVDTEGGINKVSLNVASYPVGTYFATIKNGEEVATTKFVKE
ncbi:MAG: T9SS type A sorting domain-containing protein [Chitinophagales bacterium]